FLLVYSPHFTYSFPFHVDEWHHIHEALSFGDLSAYANKPAGSYFRFSGAELGFYLFLFLISRLFDLVTVYQFLPALWMVVGSLAIFFIVRQKTGGDFTVALATVFFFATIKSNVNLLGPWFLTPLSFAIPFILLYFYFFERGVDEQSPRFLLIGAGLMGLLVVIHPPSILFALPILALFLIFRWRMVIRFPLVPIVFALVPLLGLLVYKFGMSVSWAELIPRIMKDLVFPRGWGVLEVRNSIFEVYSLVPFILAMAGALVLLWHRAPAKRYLLYLLWPALTLIMVIIYRLSGYSFFSPYQRNFFYLALGLPILSAIGLVFVVSWLAGFWRGWLVIPAVLLIVIATLGPYYVAPRNLEVYRLIDHDDYLTLLELKTLPSGKVMAPLDFSMALYPVAGQQEVGGLAFYGNQSLVKNFFEAKDCSTRQKILRSAKALYVVSPEPFDCGWLLLSHSGNRYIYSVKPQ
ncbi:MAG: glycosyltransferase family 39 protein, partial [Candidatus Vogelbacteria bacterium]|nr:glycosyltransferase family 39 protein [Candidatus Vogelbacteria bacterium]